MAGRKSAAGPITGSSDSGSAKKAKRQVTTSTFEKWQGQFEREHQTLAWLCCDVEPRDKSHVASLYCSACRKYEDRIRGMKNFSMAWITGSTNMKTSNVVDHANSEQHKAAMARVRADQARASNEPVTAYATIARCLSTLDDETRGRLQRKFDLCYLMAKESMAFAKYPALHELEVRHGVNLGSAYSTPDSAKVFTSYLADSQRQAFLCSALTKSHFYSLLMDGTTDAGNQEDELIVLQYFSKDDLAQEIRSSTRYFSVHTPDKADASGLLNSLADALKCMGVGDILDKASVLGVEGKPALVGGGTDGASVNIGPLNGMRGKLQGALPWLFWSWCYAHRLELACKDAFASPLCGAILEMLLRLYYLYEKSPKKSRELTTIAEDLKEVFELPKGGNLPIRSNGTRWINHKRKALQRVVDRYGAYIHHLTTLAEDKSLKSTDRARLKGYLLKWRHSKILIGCAMYVDAMKPASLLSLTLQEHCVDIVLSIEHILKTSKALKSLQAKDPLEWPTVKLVRDRIKKVGEESEYQGATLKSFGDATLEYCKMQALSDLQRLVLKMRKRLEWTDTTLLRSLLVFIETRGWTGREAEDQDTVQLICNLNCNLFRSGL